MRFPLRSFWFAAALPLCLAAGENRDRSDQLVLSGGWSEALARDQVPLASVEYRFGQKSNGFYPLLIGVRATDSAMYLGAALAYDFELSDKWRASLSTGPGYYDRNRSPKDLGSSLEFLSNFEISRDIGRGQRIAVSFGHVSNGSISDQNPGTETLRFSYSVPLNWRNASSRSRAIWSRSSATPLNFFSGRRNSTHSTITRSPAE